MLTAVYRDAADLKFDLFLFFIGCVFTTVESAPIASQSYNIIVNDVNANGVQLPQ